MDPEVKRQYADVVLAVLGRVQDLFGGSEPVATPAPFVTAPDLESNLGQGRI